MSLSQPAASRPNKQLPKASSRTIKPLQILRRSPPTGNTKILWRFKTWALRRTSSSTKTKPKTRNAKIPKTRNGLKPKSRNGKKPKSRNGKKTKSRNTHKPKSRNGKKPESRSGNRRKRRVESQPTVKARIFPPTTTKAIIR